MPIDQELLRLVEPIRLRRKGLNRILLETPRTKSPIVTQLDIERGFVRRYFVRAANDARTVVEVDKKQYERFLKNERFAVTSFDWKIIGNLENYTTPEGIVVRGVKDFNQQTIINEDLTFGGLRSYISDFGEFWVSAN